MTKEEAIMAVKEVTGMSLPWNDRHYEALQMAIKALEEPERKAGRWERVDYGNGLYNYHCSQCRKIPRDNILSDFCPKCGSFNGARMEGGKNDKT